MDLVLIRENKTTVFYNYANLLPGTLLIDMDNFNPSMIKWLQLL